MKTIEEVTKKEAIIEKLPLQPGDVSKTFANINKAKERLGYNPKTKFRDGIEKFVEWYLGGK